MSHAEHGLDGLIDGGGRLPLRGTQRAAGRPREGATCDESVVDVVRIMQLVLPSL